MGISGSVAAIWKTLKIFFQPERIFFAWALTKCVMQRTTISRIVEDLWRESEKKIIWMTNEWKLVTNSSSWSLRMVWEILFENENWEIRLFPRISSIIVEGNPQQKTKHLAMDDMQPMGTTRKWTSLSRSKSKLYWNVLQQSPRFLTIEVEYVPYYNRKFPRLSIDWTFVVE